MPGARTPLFLERRVYRRRRLIDAARILPVAGLVAILLPALWSRGGQVSTAAEALYLFGLWLALILAAGALSRPLREAQEREREPASAPREREAGGPEPARDAGPGGAAGGGNG